MMHKFLAPSIIHPGFLQTFYMKKFNTLQDMHFYTKKLTYQIPCITKFKLKS